MYDKAPCDIGLPSSKIESQEHQAPPRTAARRVTHHVRPEHVIEIRRHETMVKLAQAQGDAAALVPYAGVERFVALLGYSEIQGPPDAVPVKLQFAGTTPKGSESIISEIICYTVRTTGTKHSTHISSFDASICLLCQRTSIRRTWEHRSANGAAISPPSKPSETSSGAAHHHARRDMNVPRVQVSSSTPSCPEPFHSCALLYRNSTLHPLPS